MVHNHPLSAKQAGIQRPRAIALVDPDDPARRALHLLLSSQRHMVRSYDCIAALTRDEKALRADWLIVAAARTLDLTPVRGWRSRGFLGRTVFIVGTEIRLDHGLVGPNDLIMPGPVAPHAWQIHFGG